MSTITPYVRFNGNCREAFEFYKSCLGGELAVQTVGESPMAGQMGADVSNRVLHAALNNGSIVLFGSDMIGTDNFSRGMDVSLCVVCSSPEEIKTFYSKLAAGGQATHPLKEEFFGTFGDLTDKFGVSWMLQYSPVPVAQG